MIDKDPPANGCSGMDIDICDQLGDSHPDSGEGDSHPDSGDQTQTFAMQPVGDAVVGNGPDSRIIEKEFKFRMNGWIASINCFKIFYNKPINRWHYTPPSDRIHYSAKLMVLR